MYDCALITVEGTVACDCGIITKALECLFIPLKMTLALDHRAFALICLFCGFLSTGLLPHTGWCIELWHMGVSEIKFFRHLLRGWTFWNISWRGWCPTFIPYLANERTNARMKCTDWNNTCLLPCLSPDWVISSLEVSQAYWKSCLSKVQPYSSV